MNSRRIDKIDKYEDMVKIIINENITECTIEGPPGTGKTSKIPTAFARAGKTIFIVIPTKLGVYGARDYATNISNRLLNENQILKVGTAANSKKEYNNLRIDLVREYLYGYEYEFKDNSLLVYCTPGHIEKVLLDMIEYGNQFPNDTKMKFCDYIIVDESHLGTQNIEMVIKYARNMINVFGKNKSPKLIKMSATVSETDDKTPLFKYNEIDSQYGVAYTYLDSLSKVINVPYKMKENLTFSDIINFIPRLIKEYIEFTISQKDDNPNIKKINGKVSATMLVFLPGLTDINKVHNSIKDIGKIQDIGNYEILTAHSSTDPDVLRTLLSPKPNSINWRIILSTNICETSLTIPNVDYVIDSMQERIAEKGNNDVTYLKTEWISELSAKQRAGRTGRTSNGIVVRVCYYEQFKALKEKRDSEIIRLPITTIVLKSLKANIDIITLFPELQHKEIRFILNELASYCCVYKCGDYYKLTESGKFVAKIPLSAKNATFLYYWKTVTFDLFPGIVLSVAIELIDSIFTMGNAKIKSDLPFGTILNPFLDLWKKYGRLKPKENIIRKFIEPYGINFDSFYEALRRIVEIMKVLVNIINDDEDIDEYIFSVNDLFKTSLLCLPRIYNKMMRVQDNLYINPKDLDKYNKSIINTHKYELSTNFLNPKGIYPNEIYAISFKNYTDNKSAKQSITLWVPTVYNNEESEDESSDDEIIQEKDNTDVFETDDSDFENIEDSLPDNQTIKGNSTVETQIENSIDIEYLDEEEIITDEFDQIYIDEQEVNTDL